MTVATLTASSIRIFLEAQRVNRTTKLKILSVLLVSSPELEWQVAASISKSVC
jgi:hypothetical protein